MSLALASALALPHALTGILASASANTIRKNAMLLPAYSMVLARVALMGLMGHAVGLKLSNNNDVVTLLFKTLFPGWIAGFAFAAIAIGALVPAAIMSIGAANLFTRNFWKAYIDHDVTSAGEEKVAKMTSLGLVAGALLFILFLPILALDLNAWRPLDIANLTRRDFWSLHGLVPGAWLAPWMGGWLLGR